LSQARVIVPASGHAPSVGDSGRSLDFQGVAKFKFPEPAVLKDRPSRNDIAESEKV
jgi:hypothetical protein